MRKILGYIVVALFLVFIALATIIWRAANEFVKFETLERLPSPSGEMTSVLYTSDGGATTSRAMFVAVLPSGEEDFRPEEYRVLALKHTNDISMSWEDDLLLVIRLPSQIDESEFLVRKVEISGVVVRYLEQDKSLVEFE